MPITAPITTIQDKRINDRIKDVMNASGFIVPAVALGPPGHALSYGG